MLVETEAIQAHAQEARQLQRKYKLARSFVLRMTGFPIETILSAASPELSAAADTTLASGARAKAAAQALLTPDAPISRSLRRRLKRGKAVADGVQECAEEHSLQGIHRQLFEEYKTHCTLEQEHSRKTAELYEQELRRSLKRLYEFAAGEPFQQVLLLSSPDLVRMTPKDTNPPQARNRQARRREITWISYLQRLTTKNETISFFGPCAWGEIDPEEPTAASIELSAQKVVDRIVYIERWVSEALAAVISSDPEVRPFLPLQLADDVVIQDQEAVFLSTGQTAQLSAPERDILLACDLAPHAGFQDPMVEGLIERKILVRDLSVPISPYPFEALRRQIASWPEHPAKERWIRQMEKIENGRAAVQQALDVEGRKAALESITQAVTEAGLSGHHDSQALYASRLPINEDCRLGVKKLVLGQPVIEQLLDDLPPWYELWRDMAGLFSTRLHQSFRQVWDSLGGQPVPLPIFLRACNKNGLPLTMSGGTGLVLGLENEIQAAWRQQLGDRWNQPVVQLTEADTAFLRSRFDFRRMKSFDNLAPDLQIAAPNAASLSTGDWSLLVAEIHPDFTNWQHALFVWCPDAEEYARDFSHQGGHDAAVVIGKHGPYFGSAHTTLCIFPYTQDLTFVGVPGPEGAHALRSAETLVTVTADDVLLSYKNQVLGSLLNTWNVALNTHRLELHGKRDHSPRLQVGRAITQRETWILQPDDELRHAAESGGHAAFAAWRKFRKQHSLPETVFVRGHLPQRLNFHKDVKPMFMDFRNPLLIEVLSKLAVRFRKLVFTEMLPRMEGCWLEGPGGEHYSCEFRTVVMATEESRKAAAEDLQASFAEHEVQ